MCENNSTLNPVPTIEPMQSPTVGKLAGALAKAQGEVQVAHKNQDNPFHKSTYADLASNWDACKEPLTSNGLSITQLLQIDPNPDIREIKKKKKGDKGNYYDITIIYQSHILETTLRHSSGEWVKGVWRFYAPLDDYQALGSAYTYGKRYLLQGMAAISTTDDDGEGAMKRENKNRNNSTKTQKTAKPTNNKQKPSENGSSETTGAKPPLPEGKLREIVDKLDKAQAIDHLKRISAKHIEPFSLTKKQHKLLGDVYADRKKEIKAELKQFDVCMQETTKKIALIEKIMGKTYIVRVIDKHISKTLEIDSVKKATIPKHLRTGKLADLLEIISGELENAQLKESSK